MLMSQVSSEESERMKKRFYIGDEDEYNCSSEPLNGLVFSTILNAMPSYASSRRKALKQGYIADLVREGGISPCSLLLGLMYIRRLALTNQEYLAAVSSRDLFLVAMVVASKFMNDEGELEALTNSEWSAVGSTPKATVDQLERDFLKAIDWRLYIPIGEFYSFVGSVEGRVAMKQACKRGWITYTDLSAVWENSDLQVSMLKHTAKVALSGVTLYLVCVSTLLAALQPLALFSVDPSPTHPLQQDTITAPAEGQVGQMIPTAQLVPAVSDDPPPWHISDDPPPWHISDDPPPWHISDDPPWHISDDPPPWHISDDTPPSDEPHPWQEVWPTNRSQIPYNWTPPNSCNTSWTPPRISHSCNTGSSVVMSLLRSGLMSNNKPDLPAKPDLLDIVAKPDLLDIVARHPSRQVTQEVSSVNLTSQDVPPNSVAIPPLFCHSRSQDSLAKVESPHAQDLSYHQKGTFHWDPFINSSSVHNETSVTGALTFIVQYLTPHWIA